jgi:hypothetical protein
MPQLPHWRPRPLPLPQAVELAHGPTILQVLGRLDDLLCQTAPFRGNQLLDAAKGSPTFCGHRRYYKSIESIKMQRWKGWFCVVPLQRPVNAKGLQAHYLNDWNRLFLRRKKTLFWV